MVRRLEFYFKCVGKTSESFEQTMTGYDLCSKKKIHSGSWRKWTVWRNRLTGQVNRTIQAKDDVAWRSRVIAMKVGKM